MKVIVKPVQNILIFMEERTIQFVETHLHMIMNVFMNVILVLLIIIKM